MTKICIVDVTGSPVAVSTEKAQLVYNLLAKKLRADEDVELSFEGVQNVITAFLNTAVGQLYGKFPATDIRAHLHVGDATPETRDMLKKTADNAKRFFKNPKPYRQAYKQLDRRDAL